LPALLFAAHYLVLSVTFAIDTYIPSSTPLLENPLGSDYQVML